MVSGDRADRRAVAAGDTQQPGRRRAARTLARRVPQPRRGSLAKVSRGEAASFMIWGRAAADCAHAVSCPVPCSDRDLAA